MAAKKMKQFEEKDVAAHLKKVLKGTELKKRVVKKVRDADDGLVLVLDDKSEVTIAIVDIHQEAQED